MVRKTEHAAGGSAGGRALAWARATGVVLLACGAVPARAQATRPATPVATAGATPTATSGAQGSEPLETNPPLRTHVDEVVLDLVVRERGREGVPKLTPSDLTVTDDGTPVKLQGLHLVSAATDPAKKPLVTLIFDSFHGPIAKSTGLLAQRLLEVLPAQGFRMAVMDFDGRLRLMQGFTEDRAAVQRAVTLETTSNATVLQSTLSLEVNISNDDTAEAAKKKAVEAAEKNLISVAATGMDAAGRPAAFADRARAQALLTAMENADSIANSQHLYSTVAGLLALVNAQQNLRERRVIVYFTVNRHLGPASDRALKMVADKAAAAGIGIYTIDMDATGRAQGSDLPNALMNGNTPTAKQDESPALGIDPESVRKQMGYSGHNWSVQDDVNEVTDFMRGSGEDRGDPFEDLHNPLEGVSKETGAAYIDALNGTRRALQQMVQDLSSYYEATFVPATKEYDGRFHAIAIKPLRGDLSIRSRDGYYALPPGVAPDVKPYELPLLKALGDAQPPHGFNFRAQVLRFGDLPDGNTNTLAVEVPLASLALKPDAHVSLMAQVRDKDGVVVEHYAADMVRRHAAEALAHDADATLGLDHHFLSAPGRYTLEVALCDENSGKMSTERRAFEVTGQAGALGLSDLVLARKLDPVSVVDLDPQEPLLFERKKVTPILDADVRGSAKAPAVFFLMHPDAQSGDSMHLDMEVVRNGKAGKRTPMAVLGGMDSAVPYLASIGAGPLPPGDYEVKVFLSQGGTTAERARSFHVEGKVAGQASEAETPTPQPVSMDDTQIAVDANNLIAPAPPPAAVLLPISPVSGAPALSSQDAQALIERARAHATDYGQDLPRFACTEITRRAVDRTGDGRWRREDTLTEEVEFRGDAEEHIALDASGKADPAAHGAVKGTISRGEFGGVLVAVFRTAAQAAFRWTGTATLNGGAVQVYDYRVDAAHSDFSVTATNGKQAVVGFHGQVFVDEVSGRVRRITLVADEMPAGFPTRSTSIRVDYDYVAIDGLRYLMPIGAELQVQEGQHEAVMNTMEFTAYKRASAL